MKTNNFVKLLFSAGLLSEICALDQPNGQIRGAQPDDVERDLFFFDAARHCKKKLEACEQKTGGYTAPVKQMVEQLDKLALVDTTGALNDLKAALIGAEAADYSALSDRVMGADIDYGQLIDLGSEVAQAAVEDSATYRITLEIIESVINSIVQLVGLGIDVNLSPVTDLITGIRKVVARIPNDDFMLVTIREIIEYIGDVTVFIARMVLPLETSVKEEVKKCTARAMSCEFNELVMNIVPNAIGGIYLADALESAM